MSFQGEIEARCPKCSEVFETPVWSFVHGEGTPDLRDKIKARECNMLLCAHCGEALIPDVSWIYYEPKAELLAFVFPESWKTEEPRWREKMKLDYAQMREALSDRLPIDYEPDIFFGQEGLGDLLDREDWRTDERDVMEHYAQELGLNIFRASPRWARAQGAPSEFPYKGSGAPSREALIAGMKALIAANGRLTAWSDYLGRLETGGASAMPPPARS